MIFAMDTASAQNKYVDEYFSALGGISEGQYMEAIEEMAEAALKDACTATNPRIPTKREVMELYRKIW